MRVLVWLIAWPNRDLDDSDVNRCTWRDRRGHDCALVRSAPAAGTRRATPAAPCAVSEPDAHGEEAVVIAIGTAGASGRIVAQQEECVLDALFEHLLGEHPVGQRSRDLERPDHEREDTERLAPG